MEISTELYERGEVEFLDLLNAQRSLLGSEDALVQSDGTVVTNLIAVYKALGGGWETTEAVADPTPTNERKTPATQPMAGR